MAVKGLRSRSTSGRGEGALVTVCRTCTRRELSLEKEEDAASQHLYDVFRLKLRDFFGADRADYKPCLSRCPDQGISVERRGRLTVLTAEQIATVQAQFDPTRQLSLFESSVFDSSSGSVSGSDGDANDS